MELGEESACRHHITVAVIDDHPLTLAGLALAIEAAPDMRLSVTATSVEDFERIRVECADRGAPLTINVIVLDLGLPGISGPEAIALLASGVNASVLVMSAIGDRESVLTAIAAGARGYMTKEATHVEFAEAIRVVARGRSYFSPTLAAYTLASEADPPRGVVIDESTRLTEREVQVLRLVAQGERDADIAAILNIEIATVRSHLDRIRDKTGKRRRAELTRFAIEHGVAE